MSNKENNLGGLIRSVMDGKDDKVTLCKEIYAEVFSLCYPVVKDREESKTVAKRALIEVCSNIDSINLDHNVSRQIATIVSVFLFNKINGKEELADKRERKEYSYNQIQEDRKLFDIIKENANIFKSSRAYREYEGDLKNLTALQMVLIELYAYEMHSIDDIEDMLDIDSSFICSEISDAREILCGVEFEQEWGAQYEKDPEDEALDIIEESPAEEYYEDNVEEADALNDKASGVDRLEKIEKDYEPEKTISKSGIAQYWDNLSYSMKKLIVTITSVVIVLVVIVVLMASVSANQKKKVSSNGSTAAATKNTQKTESSTTKTTQSTLKSTENTTIADTSNETESETQTIKAANDNNNTNITAANRNNTQQNNNAVNNNNENSGDSGNSPDNNNGHTGDNDNKGDSGNTGDTENMGDSGNTGDNDNKGDSGNTGDNDNKGDSGNTGDNDNKGDSGNTGDNDNKGDSGNTGDNDNKGDSGNTGDGDNKGDSGNTGDSDNKGDSGSTGDNDNKGDSGNTGDSNSKDDKKDTTTDDDTKTSEINN